MARSFATHTILEKAAVDNGFSLSEGTVGGWLIWKAHAAPARLCLTVTESGYGVGSDHFGAMRDLDTQSATLSAAPPGFRAVQVANSGMLSAAASVVWRLARSLPDEPLRRYRKRLCEPPSATEVERAPQGTHRPGRVPRGTDAVLGWSLRGHWRPPPPAPARQPHRPLGGLRNDAERLNVHNGLLLAAHLDAAFDAHLISFDPEGQIHFGPKLSREDIAALGLTPEMRLRRTDPETEHRLALHRNKTTGA